MLPIWITRCEAGREVWKGLGFGLGVTAEGEERRLRSCPLSCSTWPCGQLKRILWSISSLAEVARRISQLPFQSRLRLAAVGSSSSSKQRNSLTTDHYTSDG